MPILNSLIEPLLQAYILCLINGVLMSDKLGNTMHLMFLHLFIDFKHVKRYN
ncbi:hypothetical protein CR513_04045, partial [Mucuna pruriens]